LGGSESRHTGQEQASPGQEEPFSAQKKSLKDDGGTLCFVPGDRFLLPPGLDDGMRSDSL